MRSSTSGEGGNLRKLESDRSYRHAYRQKEVANRLGEMLYEGLITHSTGSFSSPVILIKKNDGP